jgi:hypothetical protein
MREILTSGSAGGLVEQSPILPGPPVSGLFGTRGGSHRPSLTRVDNIGQLTLSQETVVLEFFGYVINPRFAGTGM